MGNRLSRFVFRRRNYRQSGTFIYELGPSAWWQFGRDITVATGVSQWNDQSGNGRHLKQATGANQPALQSDGSILFDGVSQYLQCSAFVIAQPFTFYMLFKQVAWTLNTLYVDFGGSAALIDAATTTPNITFYAGTAFLNNSLAVGSYGVLTVVGNGASSLSQVNQNAPVSGNAGAGGVSHLTLGASSTGSTPGNIQAKEAILFSGAHDSTTISRVSSYLGLLL